MDIPYEAFKKAVELGSISLGVSLSRFESKEETLKAVELPTSKHLFGNFVEEGEYPALVLTIDLKLREALVMRKSFPIALSSLRPLL